MSHPIVPVKTYVFTFIALLILLALTVAAAEIEQEPWSLITSLTIAFSKAILILLFFMHVRYNTAVIRLAAVAGMVWLAILITLTMSDYVTRG